MKLFKWCKDGGPESNVSGLFFLEWKGGFSVALLRFAGGSRDAYHSHAFNALSWVLTGRLIEYGPMQAAQLATYTPSLLPVFTPRSRLHEVHSVGTSWVLTFRGPWEDVWQEIRPNEGVVVLTHGREIIP